MKQPLLDRIMNTLLAVGLLVALIPGPEADARPRRLPRRRASSRVLPRPNPPQKPSTATLAMAQAKPIPSEEAPPIESETPAQVPEAAPERRAGAGRTLAGHRFVRSQLVEWAFPNAYLGTAVQAGFASFDGPGGTAKLLAARELVDVAVGFMDRFSLSAELGGNALTGANLDSALAVGAIFHLSAATRARIKLAGENWQFTLAGGLDYLTGKRLSPSSQQGLISNVKGLTLRPIAAFAFSPMAMLGVQASAALVFDSLELAGQTDKSKSMELGLGLNLDLESAVGLPVALPLAYQLNQDLSVGDGEDRKTEHRAELGLLLSGAPGLDSGLFFTTKLGGSDQEYTGMFRLYYHW